MRIWLLSDLHLEYTDLRQPLKIPEADVFVVAGDLCRAPANGVHWLAKHIPQDMPCVYVAGNHEHYRGSIKEGLEDGRAAAAQFANIHFLENDSVIIQGVRFIGSTLWTDYRIEGSPELAMHYARERMNDHRQIAEQRNPWKRFLPQTAYRTHQDSRRFVESALKSDPITTVVVTHHLPHRGSIPARFAGDLLNAAYASDLSSIIEQRQPTLWVHGHTHDSCDYRVGSTRIVCNPRGYDDENGTFNPQLVVRIST
ncbi:metallophosphoesterase [Mesorhizobium sp. B2-4-17]|uniref:metallophosphoesterase n=1 Tax=Mesorhizobium sp. B2-4-17 TaxID=2589932 RepID=UPI00112C68FF|nr:metallophosphoesterase [Mesorhizobium sp. B2-4-17]TPK85446.1 phosphatase [Mesorhizobium sp. B2-4-17]